VEAAPLAEGGPLPQNDIPPLLLTILTRCWVDYDGSEALAATQSNSSAIRFMPASAPGTSGERRGRLLPGLTLWRPLCSRRHRDSSESRRCWRRDSVLKPVFS